MKTFRVTAEVTISISTVVEARSEEHAKELASERPMMSLCHQCASGADDVEWITSGELDGDAKNLRVEEE